MADSPKLVEITGLAGPVYLRKLRRKSDWMLPETPTPEWLSLAVERVFLCDPNPYSLFRVETDEEFHRVIMGLNGGRASRTSDSAFLAISPEEFQAAQLSPFATSGQTLCLFANRLHFDLDATTVELTALLTQLAGVGRRGSFVTKGMTRPLDDEAQSNGCRIIPGSIECRAPGCPAP
jgi:hypothetical protein